MKTYIKLFFLSLLCLICSSATAQNAVRAKQILDKTAALVGRSGGVSASFSMTNGKYGKASGFIAIKGNRFYASTGNVEVWFDGKTQWSYMKSTNEVNVSSPNEAQQLSMNPYKFLSIYRTGYFLSMKDVSGGYLVHLKAQNPARSIQELYITIGKNYYPRSIRMKKGKGWSTIQISGFKPKNYANTFFQYNKKKHPSAEIVDLR